MRHGTLRAGLTALALLVLAGCGDDAPGSDAAVTPGDAADCPGEVLDVVVSVGAWSDVVRQVGGDCATVTTIAPDAGTPELAPDDRAAFGAADLVVLDGGGPDAWAAGALDGRPGPQVVVRAAELAGGPEREGGLLWYDPAVVPEVASAVARELARLSPDAAPYFAAQHTAWTTALQPYLQAVADLREGADGATFAATGAGFGPMAAALGLADATPAGYARAARSGGGPGAEDVAALGTALAEGSVDVLVQVGGDLPDAVRDAADAADVPVVEITAVPDEGTPFLEWQLAQLGALAEALDPDA